MSTVHKLTAVVMVIVAAVLAVFTSSQTLVPTSTTVPVTSKPLPIVDLLATPAGWVPVAYGDAQVSVPASFSVYEPYPGEPPCAVFATPGAFFVAPTPAKELVLSKQLCPQPGPARATLVVLVPMGKAPFTDTREKLTVVNGVPVYLVPPRSGVSLVGYYVPSLGVEVTADGPLARRVTDTLTSSPRAVALASGPAPAVPPSWRSVTFAGLRFSVPANWPINRTQVTPGLGAICREQGVAFWDTSVTLSTDARPFLVPFCPRMSPTPQQPENGVQVDSGLRTEPTVTLSLSAHCLVLHGLTACPATSPAYSILVLRVNVPGRNKPVFVSIGLAGNGMVARTILDSVRAG
jgi:hypothetical protein